VIRIIRILEVPLLLLIMAALSTNNSITIFLLVVSITRLVVNHITYDTIYKNR